VISLKSDITECVIIEDFALLKIIFTWSTYMRMQRYFIKAFIAMVFFGKFIAALCIKDFVFL
jgi:hypothetical protein